MVGVLRTTALIAGLAFALLGFGTFVPGGVADAAPANAVPVLTIDGHMGDWDDWGWGWLVMMPMMLIFWGGLIWLVVWLVRRPDANTISRDGDPLEIARRRYARGEITNEEFQQIRQNLSG
jgi:putative membrane protein